MISIVIPTYNSESTIKKCLDSIISQTFKNFEVLIIDAISDDKTLEITKAYQDSRIIIHTEKDKGPYDAMNKGIKLSSGSWLFFLGSDDYFYDNNVLADVYSSIENKNPDIIYGDAFFIGQQCRHAGAFTRQRFCITNICHQAIFYNKNVFNRLGLYNLEYPIYADWDFNIRCFSTPDLKIGYIDRIISYYNELSGLSNSELDDPKFIEVYGIRNWQTIEKQKIHIQAIESSREYRLGKKILAPLRAFKKKLS
ncbi:MAG: glycosyltransferase family 2 protein [Dysgonomonas sp.]|nr:glycosyltransferase family 2 protein [Dysgonomonas sp.]